MQSDPIKQNLARASAVIMADCWCAQFQWHTVYRIDVIPRSVRRLDRVYPRLLLVAAGLFEMWCMMADGATSNFGGSGAVGIDQVDV